MKGIIKKAVGKIKTTIKLYKADKELRKAIATADAKHKLYNRRFYVVPNEKDKLIILSWSDIKTLRKYGRFSNHAKEPDFIRESFYYTPNQYGERLSKAKINYKRRQWLNYVKTRP